MIQLTVIGNIGNDAIIRSVNNKKAIAFSVANNYTWTDEKGNKNEKTTWINCTMWRDENVKLAEFLKKGTKVYVQGIPEINTYKNDKNEFCAGISLTVKNVELLSAKEKEEAV